MIMCHIKEMEGIRVGGVKVNNLRYADDTALLADEEQKLQDLLDVVVTESERKGLEINEIFRYGYVQENYSSSLSCD